MNSGHGNNISLEKAVAVTGGAGLGWYALSGIVGGPLGFVIGGLGTATLYNVLTKYYK